MRTLCTVFLTSTFLLSIAYAQHRVDPGQMYERVYAIVPMVGAGTWADPKRPLFAPLPSEMKPGDRSGIIAFHHQVSDDGHFALVEVVAASKQTLAPLIAQMKGQTLQSPGLHVFEHGPNSRADIEAFRAKKKGFDLEHFRVVVP